ncbi:hypothetical protein B0H19DRAFT_1377726 [Mycena capillaripes]|nr:hypothetical protein B0H19DRAFT_1377726 [Mycena capillaripes]
MRRAQYHIFSIISILRAVTHRDTRADSRAMKRLDKAFRRSPHLPFLVRSVKISLELPVLALLAQLPLTSLREVTIHCTFGQRKERADRTAIVDVQRLFRLPSVRIVSLIGVYPSIPVLNAYFDSYSRTITTLKGIHKGAFTEHIASEGETEGFPLKLNLVALATSTSFGQWLRSPSCPCAFEHLTMIISIAPYWITLHRTITNNLPNLEYLKLLSFYDAAHVDLSALPTLRKFKASIADTNPTQGLDALLAALTALAPANRISLLHVRLSALARADEGAIRRLDAGLGALERTVLHGLTRVEFVLPPALEVPRSQDNDDLDGSVAAKTVSVTEFTSWLPQFTQLGIVNLSIPAIDPRSLTLRVANFTTLYDHMSDMWISLLRRDSLRELNREDLHGLTKPGVIPFPNVHTLMVKDTRTWDTHIASIKFSGVRAFVADYPGILRDISFLQASAIFPVLEEYIGAHGNLHIFLAFRYLLNELAHAAALPNITSLTARFTNALGEREIETLFTLFPRLTEFRLTLISHAEEHGELTTQSTSFLPMLTANAPDTEHLNSLSLDWDFSF